MPSPTDAVLLDTNVFVAAITSLPRVTDSFRLTIRLLDVGMRFVGNEVLAEEYLRYARVLPSPSAAALAASIVGWMEIVHIEDRFVRACAPYFRSGSAEDCVHAATCLQLGVILVSNDHDFDPIGRAEVIHRTTASEAIRHWMGHGRR